MYGTASIEFNGYLPKKCSEKRENILELTLEITHILCATFVSQKHFFNNCPIAKGQYFNT